MTTVIYHRADFDGLFSAAVCHKFLPLDTTFIGWDFGDPLIPFPPDGPVYIVDLSPDCILDMIGDEVFGRLTWIDHHKSSIEKWPTSIRGYRIDGVAACRLCWQWFTHEEGQSPARAPGAQYEGTMLPTLEDYTDRKVVEPLALTLAGEYDVWDKRDKLAEPFQFGLTALRDTTYHGLVYLLTDTPTDQFTTNIVANGVQARNWQQAFASQVCRERSYVREWEGRTFCVLASCHARNSMWFPSEAIPIECDALMCWRYDGAIVSFSLYHAPGHEEHDLSQIAVKYGGGGHRGACGFSLSLQDAMAVIQ